MTLRIIDTLVHFEGPWAQGPRWMLLFFTKTRFVVKTCFEQKSAFYNTILKMCSGGPGLTGLVPKPSGNVAGRQNHVARCRAQHARQPLMRLHDVEKGRLPCHTTSCNMLFGPERCRHRTAVLPDCMGPGPLGPWPMGPWPFGAWAQGPMCPRALGPMPRVLGPTLGNTSLGLRIRRRGDFIEVCPLLISDILIDTRPQKLSKNEQKQRKKSC